MTIHRSKTAQSVLDWGRRAEPAISKGRRAIYCNSTGTHYKLSKLSLINCNILVFKSDRPLKFFSSDRYFFSTILFKGIDYEQKIPRNQFNESAELSSKIHIDRFSICDAVNLGHVPTHF